MCKPKSLKRITPKMYVSLTAKSGTIFEVPYKMDIPTTACASRGIKLVRTDRKALNKSYVLVL
jgi:hypothetical protein